MSLTVVVMARSVVLTMRFAMSSGDRPLYAQTTLTTGISMRGKISFGVVTIAEMPRIKINRDTTTKV
jgi:hypothetical protein